MTLLNAGALTLDDAFVCLDLETTGLDPERDAIIEVGAVRFRRGEVIDTLSTFVNPRRAVPPFVQRLTGITQAEVDAAPPFTAIADDVRAFIGDAPVVGHNVSFDLGFLTRAGVTANGPALDTRDLASMLLPSGSYGLGMLARSLGLEAWQAHRALDDAVATQQVFERLVARAAAMDATVVAELARLAHAANWPLGRLLDAIAADHLAAASGRGGALGGVDMAALERRMRGHARAAAAAAPAAASALPDDPVALAAALVGTGGALQTVVPAYEQRPQQSAMLEAVAHAFRDGHHLVVEAGTGVGKSMAYLLPAIAHAVQTSSRVIISTNTIALQEQLADKDVETAAQALQTAGLPGAADLRYTTLKGRANYLCLRRWAHMRSASNLSLDEARLLGKLTCWLQDTATGDRAELRMNRADTNVWERLSAQGSEQCPAMDGACFLRVARERAEAASIVIVNHSLLLADLAMGGGLLPANDYLVVDEAQRLEAEATSQFSWRFAYAQTAEALEELANPRGPAMAVVNAFRMTAAAAGRRPDAADAASGVMEAATRARQRLDEFFPQVMRFAQGYGDGQAAQNQLRVTAAVRAQPDWAGLEVAWENASAAIGDLLRALSALAVTLDGLSAADVDDFDTLRSELQSRENALEKVRGKADQFMHHAADTDICWIEGTQLSQVALCTAPVHVGETLWDMLFSQRRSVVLTSATLTVAGSFAPLRERLGLREAEELALGSPFDYPNVAMVCIPSDIPDPNAPGYSAAVAQTLTALTRAADGRTMALFTSHAALRAAADAARGALEPLGIRVLAQGIDGAPAALTEEFLNNPKALLLGAASFWEGVDIPGDALSVLVLARLPFDVPSDPIFAARSEAYENAFQEYAVPQAILRFRQGFGRLIRTANDRGAVVVLDRRIANRSYGATFLKSLPACRVEKPPLSDLPALVRDWLRAAP